MVSCLMCKVAICLACLTALAGILDVSFLACEIATCLMVNLALEAKLAC